MLFLNVLLALAWVALTGQLTPVNFGLGFVLGYGLLWLGQRVIGQSPYFRKVPRVIGFAGYFVWQLIVANLRVTYNIIAPRQSMRPAVVAVPLDLKSPAEITLLANLITLTPGTLSLDVAQDQRTLFVHTIYMSDVEAFRREIKEGFERYIKEIFG